MGNKENQDWKYFKLVVTTDFLGHKKNPNYKTFVADLLKNYKLFGCNMNAKVNFLHSHLNYVSQNLETMSEDQEKRF